MILRFFRDAIQMRRVIVSVFSVGLLVLLAALALSWLAQVPPVQMTRDPLNTLGAPVYIGFVSNLGVLAWVSSAAFCLCASLVLRSVNALYSEARYYLAAAAGTFILTLDDFFQFHEEIWAELLGFPELIIIAAYGGLVLAFVWRFHRFLGKGPISLIWLAVLSLGASVLVDLLFDRRAAVFVEDALKFIGILLWASFFSISAVHDLRAQIRGGSEGASREIPSLE